MLVPVKALYGKPRPLRWCSCWPGHRSTYRFRRPGRGVSNGFTQTACGGRCGSLLRVSKSLFSVCLTWNLGLLCLVQAKRRGYGLVSFFDLEFVLSSRPSKALAGRCGWLRSQIGMAFATCSRFGSNHIHELRCIKPAWVTQPQCP